MRHEAHAQPRHTGSLSSKRRIAVQVYGLDAQTDCMGRLTQAHFSRDSEHPEHPKSYSEPEVVPNLFR